MQAGTQRGMGPRTRRSGTSVGVLATLVVLCAVLLPLTVPGPAGGPTGAAGGGRYAGAFPAAAIDSVEELARAQVAQRVYPGAVLAAGIGPATLLRVGVGRLEWSPRSAAASPDSTVYDLASLSKAVATTSAVLLLWQDGRIRLDDPVQRWLPEFYGVWKDRVTWRHLLTHSSGLPPAGHMSGSTPEERLASLLRTRLEAPPGTLVQYSDVGYIVLWEAAQRVAREPLPTFLARRLWGPLGMKHTGYLPGLECESCAPTLLLNTGQPFRGKPSDPTARALGGITGNAGLFSTASDLARFASMVANGGVLDGVRVFRPNVVRQLFVQQPHAGRRTLGWDAFCPAEPAVAAVPCHHPVAFGHYGWTGTSLWVDPARKLWVVLLANRSFDTLRPKSMEPVREGVFAALSGERIGPPAAAADATAIAVGAGRLAAAARPRAPSRLAMDQHRARRASSAVRPVRRGSGRPATRRATSHRAATRHARTGSHPFAHHKAQSRRSA